MSALVERLRRRAKANAYPNSTLEEEAAARIEALEKALTPSAETEAAYIGEFKFPFTADLGDDGEETIMLTVPWTTVKEIMAAIRDRAALSESHP